MHICVYCVLGTPGTVVFYQKSFISRSLTHDTKVEHLLFQLENERSITLFDSILFDIKVVKSLGKL
jgi:hypothetical protein